jgi:PPM family protein phosphatase
MGMIRPPRAIDTGWATATGPRPDNQDRAATSARWAVVSDGAGGLRGGARAAQLSLDAVIARLESSGDRLDEQIACRAVVDANAAVRAGRGDPEVASMAATLTLAVAVDIDVSGSTWSLLTVGDSPAWARTPAGLHRLSEEDNLAAELVRAGAISRAEAREHPGRHVITRAMGSDDAVATTPVAVTVAPGDGLVLASDGVEVLDEAAMMVAMDGAPTARDAAHRLVDAALAAGATDNVTVAVVTHPDGGAR